MSAAAITVGECYEVLFDVPTRCCDHTIQRDHFYRVDVLLTTQRLVIVRVDQHGQPLDGEKQGHTVRSTVFTVAARRVKVEHAQ